MIKSDDDEREEELLRFQADVQIKNWVLTKGLPDSGYNGIIGWKLDEFAMYVEPNLLEDYKKSLRQIYEGSGPGIDYQWLVAKADLSDRLKAHLLDDRFRVEGYPIGTYEPMVISRALLEGMSPVVETSELRETRVITRNSRKFEKVRVFLVSPNVSAGRKPTYDWPGLKGLLERTKPDLRNRTELVKWCRENVRTVPGKSAGDGPDDKTIREAIDRYKLDDFVRPPKPSRPGN
jgi:hypothetical protein